MSSKMMNNALYFVINALFILEIFNFCLDFFGHVGKQLDKKANVNFRICNIYYTYIAQYLKNLRRSDN